MTGERIERTRREARAWLAAHWDGDGVAPAPFHQPSRAHVAWLTTVFEHGWAVPTWPHAWWGRGLDAAEASAVAEEFAAAGAPGGDFDRHSIPAVVLFTHGDDALKRALLPGLLSGRTTFCLLYSEPAAGSDLAGLRTSATRTQGGWLVKGQKTWTSDAARADIGLLLARTDWDAPKHRGIGFFVCPMRQPGVSVRPIRQITGDTHFNDVFLDDAFVPEGHLLGAPADGWSILQTALLVERAIMGAGAGEAAEDTDPEGDLLRLARRTGRIADPQVRRRLADLLALRACNALTRQRAAEPGSLSLHLLGKLAMSRILHVDGALRLDLLGVDSLLDGPQEQEPADAHRRALMAYMTSIGGGTDQIQRNIIAEHVLGLPREPDPTRHLPFRDVPTG